MTTFQWFKTFLWFSFCIFVAACVTIISGCGSSTRSFTSTDLDDSTAEAEILVVDSSPAIDSLKIDSSPAIDSKIDGSPAVDSSKIDSSPAVDSSKIDSSPVVIDSSPVVDSSKIDGQVETLSPLPHGATLTPAFLGWAADWKCSGSQCFAVTPYAGGRSGSFSYQPPFSLSAQGSFTLYLTLSSDDAHCEVWLKVGSWESEHQSYLDVLQQKVSFTVPIYVAGPLDLTIHFKTNATCVFQHPGWY